MKVKAKVVKNEDLLPPHVQDQQGGREKNFIPTQFRHCWVYIY
jgi:hypothetical protein